MKKWSWARFIEALLFIGVSIIFISVNFYNIHDYITPADIGIQVEITTPAYFFEYFSLFFEHTWQNVGLSMLFFGIGIIKLIGVRKNGN